MANIENTEFEILLNKYDIVLEKIATKKKKNPELIKLDYFYNNILPKSIHEKGYITLNELSSIMRYKLIRGKMRPLQKLVNSNDEKIGIIRSYVAPDSIGLSYEQSLRKYSKKLFVIVIKRCFKCPKV
jgi:hypothetical protein